MSRRTLHFTTKGFRPQIVDIAPDAQDPPSKRQEIIQNEDDVLDRNLFELEEGTKARNRAFQNRLDEVWSQTAGWEAKLKTEAREANETISTMKEEYSNQIDQFLERLLSEVKDAFDRIDYDLEPRLEARVIHREEDLDVFVNVIVPDAIDKQSGEISRQLKKAYETFDIESQKEAKREKKFVNRASEHMQKTAQRFNDEAALRAATFYNLEEDVVEHERRAARMYLRREDIAIRNMLELREAAELEAATREREDIDVLETVIETQRLLQKTVLEHFSSSADDGEPITFPSLERLALRMQRQRERKEAKEAKETAAKEAAELERIAKK